jgi:hypothetical protein
MTDRRTRYREWSSWPPFVTVILWIVVPAVCWAILNDSDEIESSAMRWLLASSVVGLVLLLRLVLGGLTVMVQETRLVLNLGKLPLVRRIVPFAEIVSTRVVRYRPLAEFGGWGVRGVGRRRAWTARGNQAVELSLTGDRILLVGSDHPHRLESAIRTHGAPDIGRTPPTRAG